MTASSTGRTLPPLLRAGLQSGTIMGLADIFTQLVVAPASSSSGGGGGGTPLSHQQHEDDTIWDPWRTLRWSSAGLLLHGPYFYRGFSWIDKTLLSKSSSVSTTATTSKSSFLLVLYKTAMAQFILFPPYLIVLFTYLGIIEQHPNIHYKVVTCVPDAFTSGCFYWPIANGLNFWLVPTTSTLRIPFLAVSTGIWNSYLSWTNASTTNVTVTTAVQQ